MTILLAVLAVLAFLGLTLTVFVRSSPASVAGWFRVTGPVLLAVVGVAIVAVGGAAIGSAAIGAALVWLAAARLSRPPPKKPETARSMVRTAALEMELDHATGGLEGLVLAGRREGRTLGRMRQADLIDLYRELSGDSESRQLLEAYLDSRFAGWRKDAQANFGAGLRGAPGSGPMTKEEAYKVLGLEAGAAAADVREAHRRLIQRLHPEVGRASILAARINEAKDILLSDHN